MAAAEKISACPLCGGAVGIGDKECGTCHATPQWQDYARAVDFARKRFAACRQRGYIGEENLTRMDQLLVAARQSIPTAVKEGRPFPADTGLPSRTTCWRCGRPVAGFYSYCNTCGAPLGAGADALRYLAYVSNQITRASAVQLTLAQAHACAADVRGHVQATRAVLEQGRLSASQLASERLSHLREMKSGAVSAEPGPAAPDAVGAVQVPRHIATPPPLPTADPPAAPRRSILEILLDPRSIQWLLASGGVLLVVGLVIWLASLGVFKNTLVVATCLGAGTLVVLGGGCAIVKLTRHQLAGRALALLACLVMPLNLWFYHAHGLVTLEGHLWLAALVCCVLYAMAAAILEDPVFVYVLMGGVAMTGCLILADLHKLMQVAAPSTLLVALGLISLHAERAFAEGEGPFSRKQFGMACFWSAQALLGAGLLLLLGAQLAGWIPMGMSWLDQRPTIVTDPTQRLLAIGLVLAGAYAYLYSDLVVRRVGVYVYISAFMLLWAELLVIDLTSLTHHPSGLIGILALTSLAVNLVQVIVLGRGASESSSKLARPLPTLGLLLSSVPVLLGIILHMRATRLDFYHVWPYSVTWAYVGAMALTAICCRVSAYLHERSMPRLAAAYLAATAAATLVGAAGLLSMWGLKAWPVQSPLLMVIPILYLVASRLYDGRPSQRPLAEVAHGATVLLLLSVAFSALNLTQRVEPVVGLQTNLLLSLFCAEAAIFYAAAAILYSGGTNVYLATAMACGAVWQLLNFWSVRAEYYCVTFAVLGTVLLAAYRLAAWERVARPALVLAAFRCANALMSISFVAAALMTLSRLALDHTDWSLAILLAVFSLLGLLAAGIVAHSGFRRWYVAVAIAEAALTFITVQKQIHLSPWQNIELFCVAVGLILLTFGYGLWYREQESQSDAASFCLLFGSLLAGVPLAIAAIVNRFWYDISLIDELGLATVSILMFVTGFLCRLRATTLVGGSLLAIHLAMLLVFAGMRAQLAVGVYLAIGGAVIFALGVLLSIYRDRLLALPQRIRHHEGVFGVLAWR
jgi:hypothetical protein